MKKHLTTILVLNLIILVSCKNKTENETVEPELQTQEELVSDEALKTYAVIPSLITEDAKNSAIILVSKHHN